MSLSHYHITLDNINVDNIKRAAKLIKGKVTNIDLSLDSGEIIKDRMITKYQVGSSVLPLFDDVLLLRENKFNVSRYKLEMMFSNFSDIEKLILSDLNYIEIHIKVSKDIERKKYKSFALSRNTDKTDYYFYNGRCRDKKHLTEFIKTYDHILNETGSSNVHLEYTIYDSKPNHDSKWS